MLCFVHFEDYIDKRYYKETLDCQTYITTTKLVAYETHIPSETYGIRMKFNITGYEFILHRHDIRNTNYIINKFKENEEYKDLLNSVLEKYPERKYKILKDNYKKICIDNIDIIVYRIKALKDFGDVKKGDIGGYVQSKENLSQLGNCWIYNNAIVSENAKIEDNVKIYDNANVYDNVVISECAKIEGNAKIYDNTNVSGNAVISDCAKIFGNVKIKDNAKIHNSSIIKNYAIVMESAQIYDYAIIEDNAKVAGNSIIYDNVVICENSLIVGNSIIRDNCIIFRNAVIRDSYIFGKASIGEDAKIFNSNDYISISNINNNSLTVFRAKNNELNIVYSNCSFTFREFIKYVKIIQCKKYRKELLLALKFAKRKLSIKY